MTAKESESGMYAIRGAHTRSATYHGSVKCRATMGRSALFAMVYERNCQRNASTAPWENETYKDKREYDDQYHANLCKGGHNWSGEWAQVVICRSHDGGRARRGDRTDKVGEGGLVTHIGGYELGGDVRVRFRKCGCQQRCEDG